MHSSAWPVRRLTPEQAEQLIHIAEKLLTEHGSTRDEGLLDAVEAASNWIHPATAEAFRPDGSEAGLFVVRGLEIDDAAIGPTPSHWSLADDSAVLWDIVLLLITSLIGRPIAWSGQQEGRVVNNIVPARGHENEQTGASSTVLLSPHTEDAFHPQRAHLLVLCCMRNHDAVATTAASVRRAELTDGDIAQLTQAVTPILPDDAYTKNAEFTGAPPAMRTLWQTPDGLTLRFDPAYTDFDAADEDYRAAYARLETALAEVSIEVVLEPGDVLVVDNDVAVHGRVPFKPRYDGTDRWLKRSLARVPGRRSRPQDELAEHGYGQAAILL